MKEQDRLARQEELRASMCYLCTFFNHFVCTNLAVVRQARQRRLGGIEEEMAERQNRGECQEAMLYDPLYESKDRGNMIGLVLQGGSWKYREVIEPKETEEKRKSRSAVAAKARKTSPFAFKVRKPRSR